MITNVLQLSSNQCTNQSTYFIILYASITDFEVASFSHHRNNREPPNLGGAHLAQASNQGQFTRLSAKQYSGERF